MVAASYQVRKTWNLIGNCEYHLVSTGDTRAGYSFRPFDARIPVASSKPRKEKLESLPKRTLGWKRPHRAKINEYN